MIWRHGSCQEKTKNKLYIFDSVWWEICIAGNHAFVILGKLIWLILSSDWTICLCPVPLHLIISLLPLSLSLSLSLSLFLSTSISLSLSLFLYIYIYIYSASQKKWKRELSMFYHNLITIIINKWHIFVKLRSSSFIWCKTYDVYFTHE